MRLVLASSLALLLGCAHEAPVTVPLGTLKAAIQQNESQFAQALMRGDAAAVANLFREDAQYIPGWQKGRLEGRAAIQALFQQRLAAAHFLEVVMTTGAVGTDGDLAYETGTNRLTRQTGDAPPVTTTGRYLTVWHHQPDGQWRIQVDMVVVDPP
jgi:uncharacterized protein (TIGR02246 family)